MIFDEWFNETFNGDNNFHYCKSNLKEAWNAALKTNKEPVAEVPLKRGVMLPLSDKEIGALEAHFNMYTTTMDDRNPDYLIMGEIYNKFLKAIGSEKADNG